MALPEQIYVTVDEEEDFLLASETVEEAAAGMVPGDTQVVGVYKLVGKQALALVASLGPAAYPESE